MNGVRGLIALLVTPRRIAARAASGSMRRAWSIHLLGVGLFAGWVAGWVSFLSNHTPHQIDAFWSHVFSLEGAASAPLAFAAAEVGVLVAGAWWSAWGAGDEPVAASITKSVKRILTLTPHAATGIAAVWWGLDALGSSDLDARGATGRVLWLAATQGLVLGAAAALVVTTARASASGRASPRCRFPPGCETCGYLLAGLARGALCPECETPTSVSLSDEARRGLWRPPRARGGRIRGRLFAPDGLGCFVRAPRCGRAVRLFDADQRPGRCAVAMAGAMVAVCVVTGGVWMLLASIFTLWRPKGEEVAVLLVGSVLLGGWLALGAGLVAVGTASLSGWAAGRAMGRNLMPAAIQLALRMSGAMPVFVAAYATYLAGLLAIDRFLVDLDRVMSRWGLGDSFIGFVLVLGPAMLFLMLWTSRLAWATRAARFANV